MKVRTFAIACALILALFLFAQRHNAAPPQTHFSRIVDLTHPLSEKSPNWEGTAKSPFQAQALGNLERHGYFSRHISLPEHFSTHIDAPAHFARGAWTVDQIPPERLLAPLVVLDVAEKCRGNADYQVTPEDIASWEQANGQVPPGAVVMARTGWSARWASMQQYRNADAKGVKHFPGFAVDTVKFLVEARKIAGLGIDTLSVDYGPSDRYLVHRYTAPHNVYQLENVALEGAPAAGAIVVVAPAKLEGGSGGPVRIYALVK
jgi:kynurenine formamidase